jgi:hypothetical protein
MTRIVLAVTRGALALAMFIVAGALPAQAQDAAPLAKLDQATRFTIDVLMDSAVAESLPTRPLFSKALEGISRKADSRRIIEAVRKQLAYLRTARTTLGEVDDEELTAAAAVLEAGARPAQLASFRGKRQGRSDLEAFTIWADFLARGVPRDEASSAITSLWLAGADDATFHSLWNNVQSDILQGLTPGTALQNRIRESPGRAPTTSGKPPEGQET